MRGTQDPLVSIIITTYNRSELLKDALNGAISQTYVNLEIVISDNCSIDNTTEIVQLYQIKDKRIKYHRNTENIGAVRNHHLAFEELAKGDYAVFVSDDDYLTDPLFIENGIRLILDQPKEVAFYQTGFVNLFEETSVQEIAKPNKHKQIEVLTGASYFENYFEINFFSFTTTIFNRKAVREHQLDKRYFSTDVELMLALALINNYLCILSNDVTGVYRIHASQNWGNAEFSNYVQIFRTYRTTYELSKLTGNLSKVECELWKKKAESKFRADIHHIISSAFRRNTKEFIEVKSWLLRKGISIFNRLWKKNFIFLNLDVGSYYNRKGFSQELNWYKQRKRRYEI